MSTVRRADLQRFLALHPNEIDLSLGRIERLLDALGDPQRRLPPVIHVAGTNGKGSTIAFMRGDARGGRAKRVHVYTSPHLVRFHERIRLGAPGGGRFVDEDALGRGPRALRGGQCRRADHRLRDHHRRRLHALRRDAGRRAPARSRASAGACDATNVVDAAARDGHHLDLAGPRGISSATRSQAIASEKAGILKRGCPAVVAPQDYARPTRDRARGRAHGARAARRRRPGLRRARGAAAAWSTRTRTGFSTCRCRASPAATRSTMPASPSPRCARGRLRRQRPRLSRRGTARRSNGRRACSA